MAAPDAQDPALPPPGRARLLLALGLAVVLIAIAAAVVLLTGGDSVTAEAADPDCLEQWNSNPAALVVGAHQASIHRYSRVQILRLSPQDASPDAAGNCAIAFAASELDAEAAAAALIFAGKLWRPVSDLPGVDSERLASLQSDAVPGANATIDAQGRLTPLDL